MNNDDKTIENLKRGREIAYRLFMYGDRNAEKPVRPGEIRYYGAYKAMGELIQEKEEAKRQEQESQRE